MLAVAGALFSLYLAGLQAFEIHAYCAWCLSSAVIWLALAVATGRRLAATRPTRNDARRAYSGALACATLMLLLALPSGASAHTIKGLVHDARDVVLQQVPGTHARHLGRRRAPRRCERDGARVVEVLDLQGLPALKLDARGGWARKGAPIVTVLSVTTGAPDPRDAALAARRRQAASLRFHYPGTHGEVLHRWSVPLRVDGRTARIEGAVERVARPPLAWPLGAGAALVGGRRGDAAAAAPAARRVAARRRARDRRGRDRPRRERRRPGPGPGA